MRGGAAFDCDRKTYRCFLHPSLLPPPLKAIDHATRLCFDLIPAQSLSGPSARPGRSGERKRAAHAPTQREVAIVAHRKHVREPRQLRREMRIERVRAPHRFVHHVDDRDFRGGTNDKTARAAVLGRHSPRRPEHSAPPQDGVVVPVSMRRTVRIVSPSKL